jgi:signal transduction histidine kinase
VKLPPGFRAGWLGKLSHDLRNQLSPMRTATQLLQSGRLDASRQAEMLDLIERQVQRMARMLDDVSEYGHLADSNVRREALDLGFLLDSAIGDCGPKLRAAGHGLEQDVPQAPMPLLCERRRMVQMFVRLIDNAVRFTPPGGRIALRARVHDGVAEVTLRDGGSGIEPARLDEIFRLPEASRSAEGLGISLLLARACAEDHGGSLQARSAGQGEGAEFVVQLPLHIVVPA